MKYLKIGWILVIVAFIGAVCCEEDAVKTEPSTAPTVEDNGHDSKGIPNHYNFAFQTENGQIRDENIDLDTESVSPKTEVNFKGSYSFISADGYEYQVYYKADKKGYRPYVTAHKIKTDKDKTA